MGEQRDDSCGPRTVTRSRQRSTPAERGESDRRQHARHQTDGHDAVDLALVPPRTDLDQEDDRRRDEPERAAREPEPHLRERQAQRADDERCGRDCDCARRRLGDERPLGADQEQGRPSDQRMVETSGNDARVKTAPERATYTTDAARRPMPRAVSPSLTTLMPNAAVAAARPAAIPSNASRPGVLSTRRDGRRRRRGAPPQPRSRTSRRRTRTPARGRTSSKAPTSKTSASVSTTPSHVRTRPPKDPSGVVRLQRGTPRRRPRPRRSPRRDPTPRRPKCRGTPQRASRARPLRRRGLPSPFRNRVKPSRRSPTKASSPASVRSR